MVLRALGVLGLILGAGLGVAAEDPPTKGGIIAVEWAVRQEIEEVFTLIERQRQQKRNPALYDRILETLRERGERIYFHQGEYLWVSEAIIQHLKTQGLLEPFLEYAEPLAASRLAEAQQAGDLAGMRLIARQFPGSRAAQKAWRFLADRAWDRGHLDRYIAFAERAGERDDPQRRPRLETALRLSRPKSFARLPGDIHKPLETWTTIYAPETPEGGEAVPPERGDTPSLPAILAADPRHKTVVLTDGKTIRLFDGVDGTLLATRTFPRPSAYPITPAVDAEGRYYCLAKDYGDTATLLVLDATGAVILEQHPANLNGGSVLSDPIVTDSLLAFAENTDTGDGTSSLRIHALDRESGKHQWSTSVGQPKTPGENRFRRHRQGNPTNRPSIIKHMGHFAVTSNSGIMALVDTDGAIQRLWAYHQEGDDEFMPLPSAVREGRICGDGPSLVFSPADTGKHFLYNTIDRSLQTYTGTQANDQLLDCRDGIMYLTGKRLTAIELDGLEQRWQVSLPEASPVTWAQFDETTVLLRQGSLLCQYVLATGKSIGWRRAAPGSSLTVLDGMFVMADQRQVVAYGDAEILAKQYRDLAATCPDDPGPLLGLASLAKRQRPDEAYDLLCQALAKGAPRRHLQEALALWRAPLPAVVGTDRFPALLARLDPLKAIDPGPQIEARWWQARHAELGQRFEAASAIFRELLQHPRIQIPFANGLIADSDLLAMAGLARLGAEEPPQWMRPATAVLPPPATRQRVVFKDGHLNFSGQPLVFGDRLLAFANGNLRAFTMNDGEQVWERPPADQIPPLLGVRLRPEEKDPIVDVIPGTTASLLGIVNGDCIVTFNNQAIASRIALIRQIARLRFGAPFSLVVRRDGKEIPLAGTLGSEIFEPVAASDRFVLTRKMTTSSGETTFVLPEIEDPRYHVYAMADGSFCWQHVPFPKERDLLVHPPRLTADDMVLSVFGSDIVAYDLRSSPIGKECWRLAGLANAFGSLRLLGPTTGALIDPVHNRLVFVDLTDGHLRMEVPCDPDSQYLIASGELAIRSNQGNLHYWNLGTGENRWVSRQAISEPVAFAADGLFCLDANGRLVLLDRASGERRRLYSEWSNVSDGIVFGPNLVVHARRRGRRQYLAAIGLGSGKVAWERELPFSLEVADDLQVLEHRLVVELIAREQLPSVMVLDQDGTITGAHQLQAGEHLIAIGCTPASAGPQGIRLLPDRAMNPPSALVLHRQIRGGETPTAYVTARLKDLDWQPVGNASCAIVALDDDLVVVVRLAPENGITPVDLRVCDGSFDMAQAAQFVRFVRERATKVYNSAPGWGIRPLGQIEAKGMDLYNGVILTPPTVKDDPLTRPLLRLGYGAMLGPMDPPWWLRESWREVKVQP